MQGFCLLNAHYVLCKVHCEVCTLHIASLLCIFGGEGGLPATLRTPDYFTGKQLHFPHECKTRREQGYMPLPYRVSKAERTKVATPSVPKSKKHTTIHFWNPQWLWGIQKGIEQGLQIACTAQHF